MLFLQKRQKNDKIAVIKWLADVSLSPYIEEFPEIQPTQ